MKSLTISHTRNTPEIMCEDKRSSCQNHFWTTHIFGF